MNTWLLIEDSPANPAHNMAKDHYLYRRAADWDRPILRLYEWNPPALSLGRNQRITGIIDPAACARLGIPLIRRMTGGWAVLHGADLTYAVIAPRTADLFGETILSTYRAIAAVFVHLFRGLGYAPTLHGYAGRERLRMASPICFATPSACELLIDGKKLIGSAQRRGPEAFLQHGSIPLSPRWGLLASLFTGATEADTASTMTDLESIGLWERTTPGEFRARLLEAFERVLGARFTSPPWRLADEQAVRALEAEYAPLEILPLDPRLSAAGVVRP